MTVTRSRPSASPAGGEAIPAQYDPRATEPAIYRRWLDAGVFAAHRDRATTGGGGREPFVIMMPPPNVTAILHTGHGLTMTVQDVITRWRRMAGDEALWLPGTDHAGIATQNVVEKLVLKEDNKSRHDIGREAFVKRTERFVAETGGTIIEQLKAIGASPDWSRTAYTLSPEMSRAVREAFVLLFEEGLIYRGKRVHHWCPHCLTSLSDEEAEHSETHGALHYIQYALESGDGAIMVATTRPETMLGDVAVAVHPADERYRQLIGKRVILPISEIPIPIIGDETVDQAFGTGAVKITPAHDPNDFEMGTRHGLPMPVIMTPDGKLDEVSDAVNRVPEPLRGMDRFAGRKRIIEMLRETGRLVKIEAHDHAIRHCYRCDTVVEPRLSDQWFVRMKPLAEPALAAVNDGRIRIVPERWEAVYRHWMENIRDWNISRQLWWGHRIPVFYCDACGWQAALRDDPTECPKCAGAVRQDEDVLDTWFSSWLWPISTLGWPDKNARDLATYYPGDVLVSGPDILFFWIARMVMSGMHFVGRVPFHTIYLHGIVRDTQHRKMSKSLGNGIDPMDVVSLYGADAMRYTLISGMGVGTDVLLDPADLEKSFAPGRNFITKLWNIGRFLLGNVGEEPVQPIDAIDPARMRRADAWILDRLAIAIRECDAALGPAHPSAATQNGDATWAPEQRASGLRLSEYAEVARRFVWNELADWYVEAVKPRLNEPGADRDVARAVLVHAFDAALRLFHPIVPFVTEALWQRLPGRDATAFLATSSWPVEPRRDAALAAAFERAREVVSAVRAVRADYAVPPARTLEATLVTSQPAIRSAIEDDADMIARLARAKITVATAPPSGSAAHVVLSGGADLVVPLEGVVDVEKECGRIRGELQQLEKQLAALSGRLANESFTSRAPAAVVEAERQKQQEWSARREQLAGKVRVLCG